MSQLIAEYVSDCGNGKHVVEIVPMIIGNDKIQIRTLTRDIVVSPVEAVNLIKALEKAILIMDPQLLREEAII